jgi:pyruvate ferredoxin oxidoreductase alpha subunit
MEMIEDEAVKKFVGEYNPEQYLLDVDNPITVGPVALQNSYFEFRKDMADQFPEAEKELQEIYDEYAKISGRKYSIAEKYQLEDAETVLVSLNSSVCGTAMDAIDKLRSDGKKVGLLEISLFRPFPYEEVKNALDKAKEIIVLDRNLAFGTVQVLAGEIEQAIGKKVKSVVYGLGGRDTFQKQIIELVEGKNENNFLM